MTVICKGCDEKRSNNDCIVYPDYSICDTCVKYYNSENGKKRPKKLKECDVFTLKLNRSNKDHYGFVEWGKAKEMGKMLVIIFDIDVTDKKWSKFSPDLITYLINESKNSFKKETRNFKDSVIKRHPELNFTTFKEYRQYLKSYQTDN